MVTYSDLLGSQFAYNARGEDGAYDCYGLCMEISRRLGKELPDVTTPEGFINMEALLAHEAESGKSWLPVPPEDAMWGTMEGVGRDGTVTTYGIKEGAIAYFRVKGYMAHVGIIIGPDRFIHAWELAGGVAVERLSLWRTRLVGIYEHRPDSR